MYFFYSVSVLKHRHTFLFSQKRNVCKEKLCEAGATELEMMNFQLVARSLAPTAASIPLACYHPCPYEFKRANSDCYAQEGTSSQKKTHRFLLFNSRCRTQTHPGYISSAVCGRTKPTLWGRSHDATPFFLIPISNVNRGL